MSVLGCQLSQLILNVQGSARGSALLPDRQGSMSASLTNRNLTLPAGAACPYWLDNSYATEQDGSFVPPALTTSIEKILLVMPTIFIGAAVLQQAFMVPAHFCTDATVWCRNGTEQCTNIRRAPGVCFIMLQCCDPT